MPIAELVANAWDAGASTVKVTIPEQRGDELVIDDDGKGLTREQFTQRWMTLGYDRVKHQGPRAEFPPGVEASARRAYGQNGVGRHGLLYFGQQYVVETRVGGEGHRLTIATSAGAQPFVILKEEPFTRAGHGTRVRVDVTSHRPPAAEQIRDVLSAHFLYDPKFRVAVNGVTVELADHKGLHDQRTIEIAPGVMAELYAIDSSRSARTTQQHGVAFWVGGRLVGEPSWTVGGTQLLDGRGSLAKRLTVVVRLGDAFFSSVEKDWSAFKDEPLVAKLFQAVAVAVGELTRALMTERIAETKNEALKSHATEIASLSKLAQHDVEEFVQSVAAAQPTIAPEILSVAAQALIKLEQTRSGQELLTRIALLSSDDVEGLNRILSEWSVRDALSVLDEIGRRLKIIEALERLTKDPKVDELSTIHPLITQARWIFGPQYESAEFASNVTLKSVVEKLFGKSLPPDAFTNWKKRPDLVFTPERTYSIVGTERPPVEGEDPLPSLNQVLLIELKRGSFELTRKEVDQTNLYVDELLLPNVLDGTPRLDAYVVGHTLAASIQDRTSGTRGNIYARTYGHLIRAANLRLFKLREVLDERFPPAADVEGWAKSSTRDMFAKGAR